MLPSFAADRRLNGRLAQPKIFAETSSSALTKGVQKTKEMHNTVVELMYGPIFTLNTRLFAASLSAFCDHIPIIVPSSPQKKMCGVTARRVVTGVADTHAGGYRAVRQFIRKAVGRHIASACDPKSAVTKRVQFTGPAPTPVILNNFIPKYFHTTIVTPMIRSVK